MDECFSHCFVIIVFRSVAAFAISITNGSFAWGRGKHDIPTLKGYEVNICLVKLFVASSCTYKSVDTLSMTLLHPHTHAYVHPYHVTTVKQLV